MVAYRSTSLTLALMIALGVAPLTGCTSWRVQHVAPEQLIDQRHPREMRVKHDGGTTVVLDRPWVGDDSLVGVSRRDTVRIALSSVETVSIRRFDPLETAGLAVLVSGSVLAISCAAFCDFGTVGLGY